MSTPGNTDKGAGKKLPKPNNIVTVPTSLDTEFFKLWCVFLKPFVNLSSREIDVLASFLKQRWELSKSVSDPSLLDQMMMSEMVKEKVVEECGITPQHFYVITSTLRKHGVIVNNTIHPRLIPNIRKDDNGCFQLLILFKDKDKQ